MCNRPVLMLDILLISFFRDTVISEKLKYYQKGNNMMRILLVIVSVLLVMNTHVVLAEQQDAKAQAIQAAQSWLALVDKGNYGASWQQAATYFQKAITQAQWSQTLGAVRKPLGKVLSRTVKNATYKTALPGAPDGQYYVIQFTTSYEHKKNAIETVTPMLDIDKKWRVSGYYIK